MGIIWSDINLNHSTILQSDSNALEFAYLCTKLFSWMLCMPWFFCRNNFAGRFSFVNPNTHNYKKKFAWIDINAYFPLVKACEKVVFSPMIIRQNSSVIFSKWLLWLFWMWHECILFIYLHTATLWLYIRTLFELVICRLETKWFSDS